MLGAIKVKPVWNCYGGSLCELLTFAVVLKEYGLIILFVGSPCGPVSVHNVADGVIAYAGVTSQLAHRYSEHKMLVNGINPFSMRDLTVDLMLSCLLLHYIN